MSWRPRRDLNPCRRRERPVSWARLDDGDFVGHVEPDVVAQIEDLIHGVNIAQGQPKNPSIRGPDIRLLWMGLAADFLWPTTALCTYL